MGQILNQEGRFKARPKRWMVEENRNTGTLQFGCVFGVTAALNGSTWEDWTQYEFEKSGYFYLSKKDGAPNESAIKQIREAFGWDGMDLLALQNTDWSGTTVQIVTAFEAYNGENRLKIRFLNPENWEGGQAKPLDESSLKALNAKWGSKLRALAPKGAGKPAAPPVKAAPAPQTRTTPPPPPPVQSDSPVGASRESAWEKVVDIFAGNAQAAAEHWPTLLAKLFPNRSEKQFGPADWAVVEARAADALPF
jgi:hypothetical protein